MDEKIAVIGAGTMGVGIAQVAASAGCPVTVIDPAPDALLRGRENIARAMSKLVERGKFAADQAAEIVASIQWSTELTAAAPCTLVVEAIVERMDVKRRLFADLAAIVDPDTILASNTSSLSITQMARDIPASSRFLGLHFFNPVPAMKLVEIVAGDATASEPIARMHDLMARWGKRPVSAKDVPGFIVNRVARPFYAEAFAALDGGVEAITIDTALREAGGFRMGPLTLADLIGHDINFAAASSVYDGMQAKARFRPQAFQAGLVRDGLLGRKSGRGVYDYSSDLPILPLVEAPSDLMIAMGADAGDMEWIRPLIDRLEPRDLPPGYIAVGDVILAQGDGRSLSTRDDVDALLDHAIDPVSAAALVVSVRNAAAAEAAACLAEALGKRLILIADRPGQIVLRTLAQIANGAADALRDGVASAEEIDEAMIYGANYPLGPLAWARRYSLDQITQALNHILYETDDNIYIPSSGFGRLQA
jgi:3-hydroxybutyryl-CoA dehydrogenase